MQHHGLENFFDEVITNPAEFRSDGLLKLERRVLASAPQQHGCKIGCSPNMCKGALCDVQSRLSRRCATVSPADAESYRIRTGDELDAFVARHGGWDSFDRVIYVGDGGNDFCPLLRMRS